MKFLPQLLRVRLQTYNEIEPAGWGFEFDSLKARFGFDWNQVWAKLELSVAYHVELEPQLNSVRLGSDWLL